MQHVNGSLSYNAAETATWFEFRVSDLIRERFSCRVCLNKPVEPAMVEQIKAFSDSVPVGPMGTPLRFKLVVSSGEESKELKGLGTYGFIRDPAGFIIGTAGEGNRDLEDFGYIMEALILYATRLGLGTCWLGGSFTKSSFSERMGIFPGETLPAVVSFGYPAEKSRDHSFRRIARSDSRLPWEKLFFDSETANPLRHEDTGPFAVPLELTRLAPSSNNYQPWRILKENNRFHFYLRRKRSLGRYNPVNLLLKTADLQRVDMGIAMCHFELSALEQGRAGKWEILNLFPEPEEPSFEYRVSWISEPV